VSQYQKGKTNLDFIEARDCEWLWHRMGHMQVCTSLQTDNYASNDHSVFLQARCPSCCLTNSVKTPIAHQFTVNTLLDCIAMHIILAYCYICSMVCLLVFSVSPAKTAEPTEMQFVEWTHEGPRNHVLDGTHPIDQSIVTF